MQSVDQDVVVDPVKELLQANVRYDSPARLHVRLRGQDRAVHTPSGPGAVAVHADATVQNWLQHLQQRLLDQPVRHRRDAKLTLAFVRFRDRYPPYRTGPVRPLQQVLTDRWPRRHQIARRLVNVQTINACDAFVRPYPFE